jgi:carbon monoxide dehydrogenase subunit G
MARFVDVIDLPLPPEAAFDLIADFSRLPEWDPGVLAAQRLDAGPLAVGSRFEVAYSFLGRQLPLSYEVRTCERPHRVVLRGGNGTIRSIDEISFVPRGRGTRVAYEARLEPRGLAALADPFLQLVFPVIGRAAVRGLVARARALSYGERRAA